MKAYSNKIYAFLIIGFCILFGLIYLLVLQKDYRSLEYYIALTGKDTNPGTKQKPLATLEGAQRLIKEILKEDINSKDLRITVYLRGGEYYLDKGVKLSGINSKYRNVSTTFKPYNNEIVSFVGGKKIASSKFLKVSDNNLLNRLPSDKTKDNVLVLNMKENKINYGSMEEDITRAPELFVNGNPIILARWPNSGYENTGRVINSGDYTKETGGGFVFQYINSHIEAWKNIDDVWLSGYWRYNWWDDIVKLNKVDALDNSIETNKGSEFGIAEKQRYYYFNVPEELDTPGEGYIDRKEGLMYIYPETPLTSSIIQISQLQEPFITLDSTSNIEIQGLIFEASKGGGILIKGGSNNLVNGCTIRNLGDNAVTISGGISNGVKYCKLYNLGRGGIDIAGGDRQLLTPSNNFAVNNDIYNYSRIKKTYSAAVKISGVGNIVSHNSIHDAPHLGIWFSGNDNHIEYNEIYSIAEDTDDVGAIYSGRDWSFRGNIIRYNFLHHINSLIGGKDVCGVYLDDCMSSAEVTGNVFYKVDRALMLGGGRDHIIKNNIIADCKQSVSFDDRGIRSNLEVLKANLKKVPIGSNTWIARYPALQELLDDSSLGIPKGNIIAQNILYNSGIPYISNPVKEYGQVYENVIYQNDPGFKNIENMNLELNSNSKVYKDIPKFIHIPFSEIGIK